MYSPLAADKNNDMNKGFVLIYALVFTGVTLSIITVGVSTVLFETRAARNESESVKAFYAADTAIECMRFFQNNYRYFDPPNSGNINCGVPVVDHLQTFNTDSIQTDVDSNNDGTPEYSTYSFTIQIPANSACARITATARPRSLMVGTVPTTVYDLEVVANGRNRCSGTGQVVERTRWENM
jgi:Tfp pilus assembly protein PilX